MWFKLVLQIRSFFPGIHNQSFTPYHIALLEKFLTKFWMRETRNVTESFLIPSRIVLIFFGWSWQRRATFHNHTSSTLCIHIFFKKSLFYLRKVYLNGIIKLSWDFNLTFIIAVQLFAIKMDFKLISGQLLRNSLTRVRGTSITNKQTDRKIPKNYLVARQ